MVAGLMFDNERLSEFGGVLSFALVLNVGVESVVVISCVGHLREKQLFYLVNKYQLNMMVKINHNFLELIHYKI